jgi:hypothetical protein
VSFTDYSVGIAYLTISGLTLGFIGVSLRRLLAPGWKGAPARLVEVVLGLAALVVLAELLGSFGLLTPVAFLGLLVAVPAITAYVRRGIPAPTGVQMPPVPPVPRGLLWLGMAVVLFTVLRWAGGVQDSLDHGIYRQDSVWYHLPLAAGIFQSANTWGLRFTDPMALTAWFYPQNSELVHVVGMLAWGTDFLSPFVNLGWLGLAFLAAWCLGRPFGRQVETTIGVALVLGTEMAQAQAGNAPNDVAGIALLLAAAALLINAAAVGEGTLDCRSPGIVPVAGLAAGLAIGTKITLLVPVAVVSVGLAWMLRDRGWRPAATWLGAVLIGGGYWYLRNLAHTDNPLPWISNGPLAGPDQVGLYPRAPHSVADYATSPGIWVHQLAPALNDAIGPLWPLVLLGAAFGVGLAAARGPALERLIGLAAIGAAVAYVFIPVSASGAAGHPAGFATNLRYLAPALALGLALLPLQLHRLGVASRLLAPGLAAVFAVDALASFDWLPGHLGGGLAVVALLALLLLAVTFPFRPRHAASAVALGALLAIVVLGYPTQRAYFRDRYQPALAPAADNPGFRDSPQWRRIQGWARHLREATIGVVGPAGAFGQYVFSDSGLTNRVDYIAEPGADGAFRPITDCPAWRRAVNQGRFQYVVVTPATAFGPRNTPQESLWMNHAPQVRQILRAPPAAVYRVNGRLDPSACRRLDLPPVLAVPGGGVAIPPAP